MEQFISNCQQLGEGFLLTLQVFGFTLFLSCLLYPISRRIATPAAGKAARKFLRQNVKKFYYTNNHQNLHINNERNSSYASTANRIFWSVFVVQN